LAIVPDSDDIDQFFSNPNAAHERGEGLAFATIVKEGGDQVVGSTRFMNANLANKRVEIGFTFLGRTWQRSQTNTEAKLMTDYLSYASRRAILRLGAKG
tara:strand:- start:65 stop:361 length:297 start_codon:yes stop_codon:yes gene_type:complete